MLHRLRVVSNAEFGFKIGGKVPKSKSMRLLLAENSRYAQGKQARYRALNVTDLLREHWKTVVWECSTARRVDSRKRVPDVSRLTCKLRLNNVSMIERLYDQAPAISD